MSIITRITDLFTPKTTTDELMYMMRQAEPAYPVFGEAFTIGANALGITDTDNPSPVEQERHWRGLISRLVTMRAKEIAKCMMRTRVVRKYGPDEMEEVEDDHPWKRLIETPSPHYSSFLFWKQCVEMMDMGAGAFLLSGFEGRAGIPEGLFAIYPDFGDVRPVPNQNGGIDHFIHYTNGGAVQPIDRDMLVWLKHSTPVSPYKSASLLEQAAYHSDKDLYMQIYGRDMVKDGNIPPIYASAAQPITRDQAKEYGTMLTNDYRSAGRMKKTLVMGNGMELKTIAMNPNDMQYIETAKLNDHEIMIIFGFQPAMFAEGGVVANSQEVRRQWLQNSIQQDLNDICSDLTHQFKILFRAEDSNLCIEPPDVVPIDKLERERIREIQLRSGARTPNEFRMEDGLEEYPEGDNFFMAGSLRLIDDIVAPPEPEPIMEPVE